MIDEANNATCECGPVHPIGVFLMGFLTDLYKTEYRAEK